MRTTLLLAVIPLLLTLLPATAAAPDAPLLLYEGHADVRLMSWAAPPRCEALSHVTVTQSHADGQHAVFTVAAEGPCGTFSATALGTRDADGWTLHDPMAGRAWVGGHLRDPEGDGNHDLLLGIGPCATGALICERPPLGGLVLHGTVAPTPLL